MSKSKRNTPHPKKIAPTTEQHGRPTVSVSSLVAVILLVLLAGAAVTLLGPLLGRQTAGVGAVAPAPLSAANQAVATPTSGVSRAAEQTPWIPTVRASAGNSASPTPAAVTKGNAPAPSSKDGRTAVTAEDGLVRLAISEVSTTARQYSYQASGKTVRFFVLKSSDGVIRAALDACDVCFAAKKGYHQEGDEMVCNNCGNRFPSLSINDVQGGCNPVPLLRQVQGESLIIKTADLTAGAKYF